MNVHFINMKSEGTQIKYVHLLLCFMKEEPDNYDEYIVFMEAIDLVNFLCHGGYISNSIILFNPFRLRKN